MNNKTSLPKISTAFSIKDGKRTSQAGLMTLHLVDLESNRRQPQQGITTRPSIDTDTTCVVPESQSPNRENDEEPIHLLVIDCISQKLFLLGFILFPAWIIGIIMWRRYHKIWNSKQILFGRLCAYALVGLFITVGFITIVVLHAGGSSRKTGASIPM